MGETTNNTNEPQVMDLCAELDQLAGAVDDLKLQLGRHIRERDDAIADLEAANKVSTAFSAMELESFIDHKARAIHFIRKELAKLEVREGRLYKAGRQMVKRLMEEPKFASNRY